MDLEGQYGLRARPDAGYAMAVLLAGLAIMGIVWTMLVPVWKQSVQREKEAELIFRAGQYARAVALYQRKYANAFPPNVDVLLREKFLRKKYKDPMSADGEFQIISVGTPIPGQTTPPVVPGRGAGAGAGPGAGRGAGAAAGRGTDPTGGRGTGATLGSGLGGGTGPTASGFNRVTRAGTGGTTGPVLGVVSKSELTSLRLFNGRSKYNEWAFVATEANQQAGGAGTQVPGGRGTQRPGMEGRGRGLPATPGMGGRGMPRGTGAAPLQLPGMGGRGRGGGGSPFTVP
jgi:type II secretory pathway pseudopilin PulG